MRQENSGGSGDEMRAEYDISGGVRGKYLERYQTSRVNVMPSSLVITTNAGSPTGQSFSRSFVMPVHIGPKIQVGSTER